MVSDAGQTAPSVVSACDRPGGEPLRGIALSYNVDYSTIHRLKERYTAEA
jgi:hypothetical protein